MTHSNTLLPFIVENGDQISILSHYLGVGEGIGRRASVCIGARFGTRRGALQVRVEARFRYASSPKGIRVRVQDMEEARLRCAFQTWRVEDGRVSFDVVEQKMKWMQVSEKNPNPFQVPTLSLVDAPRSSLFSRGCSAGSALSFLSSFRFHSLSLSLFLYLFFSLL